MEINLDDYMFDHSLFDEELINNWLGSPYGLIYSMYIMQIKICYYHYISLCNICI
jgi:hypothetical protein